MQPVQKESLCPRSCRFNILENQLNIVAAPPSVRLEFECDVQRSVKFRCSVTHVKPDSSQNMCALLKIDLQVLSLSAYSSVGCSEEPP